jgi:UDP-N-acetylglucosamine--N-acetylmuramyl-(pentapeptide) pyrophosphoryl-undecaprenol N-acetylglucosamine transferase
MKIIFSGGGTLGPVTPLLAIQEIIKRERPEVEYVWVGTKLGPERQLVESLGIRFVTIASGKFRRYLSPWNLTDMTRIVIGFFQSLILLWRENPKLCVSAGGYISVPLHAAAWLLGIPTWVHEQDMEVGLAIRLMAPMARIVTVAIEDNVSKFSKKKTRWLGNPVRQNVLRGSKAKAITDFRLDPNLPTIFALGGGTGSLRVNQMIAEAVQHLSGSCNIIHLIGKERQSDLVDRAIDLFPQYRVYKFFSEEMKNAYAAADIVVARGGFGTLTELGALSKAAILVPKGGHQEANVDFLVKKNAALVLNDQTGTGYQLAQMIKTLLSDESLRKQLGSSIHATLPMASETAILDIVTILSE